MDKETLSKDLKNQFKEAMSEKNRYYCCQYYKQEITNPEILLRYYIKFGGAENYRKSQQVESNHRASP